MSDPTYKLPLARPNVGSEEMAAVREVMESGTLAMGRWTDEFEERIATAAGRRHAIAVSSGTGGLHLAVRATGIRRGDEVITTPFSFVASANCVIYEGGVPRFVDIEEETLGIDPSLVEAAANDRTRGVLPVHVFGNPCRIEALDELARQHGWTLIEDSCEALGSTSHGRSLGSFGAASVFAFYPNKQITTGEGGIVLTDDDELAAEIRSMRNQGRDEDGTWLRHVRLGYNYRMDELSAAIGVIQMRRYPELRDGRARVAAMYEASLRPEPRVAVPQARAGADVDWFVYVLRLAPEVDRDRLIDQLGACGIPSRPYFTPLHLQPYYRSKFGYGPGDFPVTERVAASTLALPFFSTMSEEEVALVTGALVRSIDEQSHA
ncbi:MAG: DegT/DnrJ/EryC1/StrS family aminotransferase [Chloroflexi bacterium]|nr:DegT/DnrJ/EryC1/StrS family aminotransferase [Chloroflexota bacterium]